MMEKYHRAMSMFVLPLYLPTKKKRSYYLGYNRTNNEISPWRYPYPYRAELERKEKSNSGSRRKCLGQYEIVAFMN